MRRLAEIQILIAIALGLAGVVAVVLEPRPNHPLLIAALVVGVVGAALWRLDQQREERRRRAQLPPWQQIRERAERDGRILRGGSTMTSSTRRPQR